MLPIMWQIRAIWHNIHFKNRTVIFVSKEKNVALSKSCFWIVIWLFSTILHTNLLGTFLVSALACSPSPTIMLYWQVARLKSWNATKCLHIWDTWDSLSYDLLNARTMLCLHLTLYEVDMACSTHSIVIDYIDYVVYIIYGIVNEVWITAPKLFMISFFYKPSLQLQTTVI